MTTDLFSNEKQGDDNQNAGSILDQLVGEGKKFKTIEDLARGKLESDRFIAQLEDEKKALANDNAQFESKLKEATKLEEIMKAIRERETGTNSKNSDGANHSTTDAEGLKELILNTVQGHQKEIAQKTNREKANEQLVAKFNGDVAKAKEFVSQKAGELGLSTDELGNLSATSPKAFATLLGIEGFKAPTSTGSVQGKSDVNTQSLEAYNGNKDEQYYIKLKQTDRKAFWSAANQQELMRYGQTHGQDSLRKILNS